MIGVFDSGAGGVTAVKELRRLLPTADIAFFPDRENAPYGTRSQRELLPLVRRELEILLSHGAELVLMACCTASTVYPMLENRLRRVAIPIIEPTARAAAEATSGGRVAVIATEATVHSHAFKDALSARGIRDVLEIAARDLVAAVERGERDGSLSDTGKALLNRYLKEVISYGADTLILGCTHFPHLEGEIGKRLPRVKIISSSREGAKETLKSLRSQGRGRTVYIGQRKTVEKERKRIWENTEEAGSTTPLPRSLR